MESDFPLFAVPTKKDVKLVYDAWAELYNESASKPVALAEIGQSFVGLEAAYSIAKQDWATIWAVLSRMRSKPGLVEAERQMLDVVLADTKPPTEQEGWVLLGGPAHKWVARLNEIRDTLSVEDRRKMERTALHIQCLITSMAGVEFCARNLTTLRSFILRLAQGQLPESVPSWSGLPPEEQNDVRQGRPLDTSAPQEQIAKVVDQLMKTGEFEHADGQPNISALTKRIVEDHPEWIRDEGEDTSAGISERRMHDRVKRALSQPGGLT